MEEYYFKIIIDSSSSIQEMEMKIVDLVYVWDDTYGDL